MFAVLPSDGRGYRGGRHPPGQDYLPRACENGSDLEARLQMLVASSMGATAFQRGLGAMHALAHPLGALYDAHHGLLNAILMPYVLRANQSVIASRIGLLARYLELPDPSFDSFLDWVLEMRAALGIPHACADRHRREGGGTHRQDGARRWLGRHQSDSIHAAGVCGHPGERGRRRAVATPSLSGWPSVQAWAGPWQNAPDNRTLPGAQCHRLRAGMPGTVAGEA